MEEKPFLGLTRTGIPRSNRSVNHEFTGLPNRNARRPLWSRRLRNATLRSSNSAIGERLGDNDVAADTLAHVRSCPNPFG